MSRTNNPPLILLLILSLLVSSASPSFAADNVRSNPEQGKREAEQAEVILCPRCGVENAATNKFCQKCGARLPKPPVVAIPDTSFASGMTLRLDLDDYVTDPDHSGTELTWTCTVHRRITVSIHPTSHIATFEAPPNWYGSGELTFMATDPDGAYGMDTTVVTVTPLAKAPESIAAQERVGDMTKAELEELIERKLRRKGLMSREEMAALVRKNAKTGARDGAAMGVLLGCGGVILIIVILAALAGG